MAIPGPREWSANQRVNQISLSAPTVPVLVLDYNADRISLLLAATGNSPVFFAFQPGFAVGQGIELQLAALPIILTFAQHGDLVKQQIWAGSSTGTGKLYLVETVWLPTVGD